jgi:hypothetical protein
VPESQRDEYGKFPGCYVQSHSAYIHILRLDADLLRLKEFWKVCYTRASVGHLAFISSLSATFAGFLIAAQMTLFSYVLASRLSRDGHTASDSPYAINLVIRLLNAEISLLWNMATRKFKSVVSDRTSSKQPPAVRLSMFVFIASLVCRYEQHESKFSSSC